VAQPPATTPAPAPEPEPAPAAAAAPAPPAPPAAAATFIGPPPTGITTEEATPEEAQNAVALTPKRKEAPPTQSQEIEKRWFDK